MQFETRVSPENSIILIMDRTVGEVPDSMAGQLVSATPSCMAIGTLCEHDGDTLLILSDEGTPIGVGERPVVETLLATPSRRLSVCNVLDVVLLEMKVSSDRTLVQVWANDDSEPDVIVIYMPSESE